MLIKKIILIFISFIIIYSCNKDDNNDNNKEDLIISIVHPKDKVLSVDKDSIIIAFSRSIKLKGDKDIKNDNIEDFIEVKGPKQITITASINDANDTVKLLFKKDLGIKEKYELDILLGKRIEGFDGDKVEEFELETNFYKKIKTINSSTLKTKVSTVSSLLPSYKQLGDLFETNSNFDADVYLVYYETPNYDDKNVLASGIVAVPKSDKDLPILSYQHGTISKTDNAPSEISENYDISTFMDVSKGQVVSQLLIESISTFGFVVSMADYIGFGVSGDKTHPYVVKKTSKTTSLNLIKAAKELVKDINKKLDGKLFLTGYSQGGYTTLATQIGFKENPIDGLQITASAPTAGVYSLTKMIDPFKAGDTYAAPVFFLYPLYVYNKVYNDVVINKYVKSPYDDKLKLFDDKSKSVWDMNSNFPTGIGNISKLIQDDFLKNKDNYPMYDRLKENNIDEDLKSVSYKCRFYHSQHDDVAAVTQATETSDKITGSTVITGSGGHSNAYIPLTSSVITWFLTLK